jgi:fermentation-respiration switch protein FrsA (DUF1100 family)
MKRTLGIALAVIVALVAVAALIIPNMVHDRVYPAPQAPLSLAGLPSTARLITVTTADGLHIKGIEVPPLDDKPVLLILHGNGNSASATIDWFAPEIADGYGVVAADYRGYNGNPGRPDAKGLAADGDAFYFHARALAGKRPVVVIGHSLGGGVAFELARRHRLDALVTIGAFATLRDAAPKWAWLLVPDDYRNVDVVPQLDEPYFLVHGTRDAIVSPVNGTMLLEAARRSGKYGAAFILVDGPHTPPASQIEQIVVQIDRWRAARAITPATIPGMRIVPFRGN